MADTRSLSPENDIFAIDVPTRPAKPAATTSLSFDGLLSPPLLLHEDLQEGCGGQLWPAGMVLAKYILTYHRNNLLKDKTIVEIGAGGGLVGLAVAKGCPTTTPLLITDQKAMLALMQKNIALNHLAAEVTAQIYDWGTPPPPFPNLHPDIVLAADCVYFEPAFPLLLQTLQDLIGPDTICYFCFKKRRKADWRFIREMQKKLSAVYVTYQDRDMDQREGIYLLEVRRKKR
jgi:protein N-lysine methyltransferase METTL21A